MEFDLTAEQRMLAETVDDLLDKRYEPNTRLALLGATPGWSTAMWQTYAELGLLGLPFDEQYGGAGMGAAELSVVMESFGRALVLEPYLATVVLGGQLVAAAGTPEQKAEILPRVCSGELMLALAGAEPGSRWSVTDIETVAVPSAPSNTGAGSGWTLTGEKVGVLGGDSAHTLVVTARTPDGEFGLFLVEAADIERVSYRQQDGLGAADVLLRATPAVALGSLAEAEVHLAFVLDGATAALCAEAVGAMDRMVTLTVEYLKTRIQFGAPIAVFQALQHRAADMYVALEQARSMALLARLAAAGEDVAERRQSVRAAKVQVDVSSRLIGQESIQLHGGIGMTMEYPVGHYFKRTAVIAKTFNDTDGLLDALARDGV